MIKLQGSPVGLSQFFVRARQVVCVCFALGSHVLFLELGLRGFLLGSSVLFFVRAVAAGKMF